MTRIMYITSSLPCGSAEAFFIPEIKALRRRGHDVLVVPVFGSSPIIHSDLGNIADDSVIEPIISPSTVRQALSAILRHPLRCLGASARLCVNAGSLRVALRSVFSLPKAFRIASLAAQWGAQHIHATWTSYPANLAFIASKVTGVPWSMSAHSGEIVEDWSLRMKLTSASFTRFVSYTWMQVALRAHGFPDDPTDQKLSVIHLGVDIPPLSTSTPTSTDPVILCPGALEPVKGHRYLLEAFSRIQHDFPSARLWFAGEGSLKQELQRRAEELGLSEAVSFLGFVPHGELLEIYSKGVPTVVVLPSLREGIPVSLVEAMSYSIPVIGTASGGTPELLRNGAGIVTHPGNVGELADSLANILGNQMLRKQLASSARNRAESEFNVESVADVLSEFYLRNSNSVRT